MSPIDKISDIRRLPRLGKIRLGEKKVGQRGSYPSATDYFVCPEEVKAVHGDTPRELPVMFPSDDIELIAPQWFKCYSHSQGLICRGDGKHCRRKVDTETGDFANKNTRGWVLTDGICEPEHCPMLGSKQCRKMMSLLFILHESPGLGVYQLDTSSFYSIVNINSQLAPGGFLRHFTGGRIAFIPLILSVEPQEVTPPGVGRKTVHVLNVRADVKLADIIKISRQKPAQVLLPTLEEDEPPEDLYPEEVLEQAEETPRDVPPEPIIEETPAATEPEGEGFHIDPTWLNETLKEIKWSEDTVKTWLVSQYKVSLVGTLEEVIKGLTREQAEEFAHMLQSKLADKQMELFP